MSRQQQAGRDQLRAHRRVFWLAWQRAQRGQPLNALEQRIVAVIAMHPEYQSLFADEERFLDGDHLDNTGIHPWLHLSLHLALEEQLATNQPPAITTTLHHLQHRCGMEHHQALHRLLDVLAETVHEAQQRGGDPDVVAYQRRLERLCRE
ncbi:MAG: DUF1841 family protein [Zetaproteobacteria bacterium]|nr:MAG: DUF1841 family protein [Zetaproteobacteria bacterium]